MNRVIKVRVWLKDSKSWANYVNWNTQSNRGIFCISDEKDENCVIQQFTGLLDKNGKEIYEGDIVKYFHYKSERKITGFSVVEQNLYPFYGGYNPFAAAIITEQEPQNCEVVGNIFQNFNLIKS